MQVGGPVGPMTGVNPFANQPSKQDYSNVIKQMQDVINAPSPDLGKLDSLLLKLCNLNPSSPPLTEGQNKYLNSLITEYDFRADNRQEPQLTFGLCIIHGMLDAAAMCLSDRHSDWKIDPIRAYGDACSAMRLMEAATKRGQPKETVNYIMEHTSWWPNDKDIDKRYPGLNPDQRDAAINFGKYLNDFVNTTKTKWPITDDLSMFRNHFNHFIQTF